MLKNMKNNIMIFKKLKIPRVKIIYLVESLNNNKILKDIFSQKVKHILN